MNATGTDWPDRYERFQRCLFLHEAVSNGTIYPRWIGQSDEFWYDRIGLEGVEYRVVNAATGESRLSFTQAEVARALADTLGGEVDPATLILRNLQLTLAPDCAHFEAYGTHWAYHVAGARLQRAAREANRDWLVSPDGTRAAFLKDHNIWIREMASGAERPLTLDGTDTLAYADVPAAMRAIKARIGNTPEARWSPDSKRLLTLQTDERHVPDLALMEYAPREGTRPKVHVNRTSLPPDERPTEFRMLSIDVDTGRQTYASHRPFPAVRMNDTVFAAGLAWWSADGQTAYFVDVERGERAAHLVAFDVTAGSTRVVFSETTDTHVELGVNLYAPTLVFPLPESNEVIWFSERSGHGHLYLYDFVTGVLKRAITSGPWQVRDVHHVDTTRREVFFTAAGIAGDESPYVCKPCLASLDAERITVLSSEPGEHIVWRRNEHLLYGLSLLGGNRSLVAGLAPSGRYFVETIAGVDRLPVTVLRRRSGESVRVIETASDRSLPPDWQWPERVQLKAADGTTNIHGLLFKPPGYDPRHAYPLIDFVYGGAHMMFAPTSAFADGGIISTYGQAAGYAALGAFCLVLDGRGTGFRERAFRDASYGALETTSNLEDHIAAIRKLAQRYPIDLDRIGVTGFSGGGYLAALAALRFGHFFKVAVAASGNYDQTLFWHCWSERYQGPYSPGSYAAQAVKSYADGLTGKLLLIHGLMDSGCHPAALFQLLQSLIEKNKDVDLVLMPRVGHELTGYGQRRLIDYFVTHLFGATAPPDIQLTTMMDKIGNRLRGNAQPPPNTQRSTESREIERVVLQTPLGRLLVEVYPHKAPVSAGAFLRYVDENAYDGAAFVRAVRAANDSAAPGIEVIQAFVKDFSEARHPGFDHETTDMTGVKHLDGTLSLARLAVGTGTPGTFFICVGAQPHLDCGGLRNPDGQGFAAFGRIVAGMDIVRRIHQAPCSKDAPVEQLVGQMLVEPVPILSVERLPTNDAVGTPASTDTGGSNDPGEVEDPYLWLEEAHDPTALSWTTERTTAAKAALSGLPTYPALLADLQDAIKLSGATQVSLFLGDKLARVRKDMSHPHGVLELAERDGTGRLIAWQTVFDVDAFNRSEGRTYEVHWTFLTKSVRPPHYDRCLIPLAPAGAEETEFREFDLISRTFPPDGFRTAASQAAAVWLGPDRLLIAHTLFDAPRAATGGPARAYIWDRGTALQDARAVLTLAPSDALMMLNAMGTGAARRAVVTRVHNYSNFSLAIIDPDGAVTEATLPGELKPFGFLAATERHFFVQLAKDARIGASTYAAESVIAYDVHPDTPASERVSLVYAFAANEFANDVFFGFAGTRTRLHFIVDRRSRRRLLAAEFVAGAWSVHEIREAATGTTLKLGMWNASANAGSDEIWVEQTGYLTPTRVDLLNPGTPEIAVHSDAAIIDADTFQVEMRRATSRDGVEIDYYLLRPRTAPHDGRTPTLITGYGAFGFTITPGYFDNLMGGHSLKLWLDRGGALAMPLIRGGGDRGTAWHAAAMREKRQTSYDDFIAAAEDLIASGFTAPRRLGVFGSSNGGLLAATVAVQRPDLFSAVVSDAPVLDMLRYHKLGIGAGLTNEYGDPEDPTMRKAILGYSPYQNLRAGHRYPPFLITASTQDNRVGPGHARKFTARAEQQGLRVLLIEEAEGGHAVSNSVTRPELMAMRMAFLIDCLMDT